MRTCNAVRILGPCRFKFPYLYIFIIFISNKFLLYSNYFTYILCSPDFFHPLLSLSLLWSYRRKWRLVDICGKRIGEKYGSYRLRNPCVLRDFGSSTISRGNSARYILDVYARVCAFTRYIEETIMTVCARKYTSVRLDAMARVRETCKRVYEREGART